ncbi:MULTISPECIES: acetate--CoA ligase family protein [unclassified Achromobacter]|uniref:acetate--CoA ligase family protein n=1 Tax=unclassified Achromobacter TaxID=2626865 RepID=UPI000B51DCA1|nr:MULTISPECIES: acetate--CoA ligase family protein [unclassified Achromobacter]OWT80474.1 acyl-CoA synthetase [Achromobacter sp. HZ34]OWT82357.1 acyl-CoA synthetase [Achromobacter sp. HZ28]
MSETSFADALLAPRAVALVGASGDVRKNTARPLRFMRKHGYAGTIYPINAGRSEILGERAYPSLDDLPTPVDHVFVMIPGDDIAPLLESCAHAGARVVTVYSDGFGETGPAGMARQEALVARARSLGLRLLGPNSIGLANLHSGAILSVNAAFEADTLLPGSLSMVSQSGSMMGSLLSRAAARGFGFAKSVSVGNESDVTVGEVIDALVDDADSKVILLFLETLRDAPTLARALERARAAGKPVVAYKLGRSEQGDALAQSHTGALAGNDAAVDAFLKAHGVLRVRQLETLFEIAPLAQRYGTTSRSVDAPARVAVITTTGGGAASVVDNLGLHGMVAVAPPPAFIEQMSGLGLKLRETPIMDLTLAATSAQYKGLLEALLKTDWCDAVLSVVGSSAQFHPDLAVKPLLESDKSSDKPLAVFLAPEAPESLALLRAGGIAAFRTPEACADALSVFFQGTGRPPAEIAPTRWPDALPRNGMLNENEAARLFAGLGVPVVNTRLLDPARIEEDLVLLEQELTRSASEPKPVPSSPSTPVAALPATPLPAGSQHGFSYPLVVKICSRDLAHKTDAGAVRVGIENAGQLRAAIAAMLASVKQYAPDARIEGILVQPMEDRLIELILGYRRDPQVGPTILLGAGGIAAELTPDYALRLAPVDEAEALRMIEEVRLTRLVRGFRGLPLGDCAALARAIAAFSRLAAPGDVTVAEAEINPLFVRADGVLAVDGLLRLA